MEPHPPTAITPETHVRLTLTRVVVIVAAIVGGAVMATTTVLGFKQTVVDHMKDDRVHIDPRFTEKHGHVIGTYDLDMSLGQMTKAADDMRKSVDALTLSPIHFEECELRGRTLTCRFRH